MDSLRDVQDKFIHHWGSLGTAWGVNRTMTQIHALLMVCEDALTTDDIMERLEVSRGNAHSNLKNLVNWGIARQVIIPGERKDFYSVEKDPWRLLCTIARERRRREIAPALDALKECMEESEDLEGGEDFYRQMQEMHEFLEMGSRVLGRIGKSERSKVLQWMLTNM